MVTGRKHAYPPGPKESGFVTAEKKTVQRDAADASAADQPAGAAAEDVAARA